MAGPVAGVTLEGMLGVAGANGELEQSAGDEEESSLADEVLQVSGILAQEGSAKERDQYTFQVDDVDTDRGGGQFELTRDDTLHLIGLLNSPEVDIAKRELGVLLGRLERPAVEGLTRRLFSALRDRSAEMAHLEEKTMINPKSTPAQGTRRVRRPVVREEPPAPQERIMMQAEANGIMMGFDGEGASPSMPFARSKSEDQMLRQAQRQQSRQYAAPPTRMPPEASPQQIVQHRSTRSRAAGKDEMPQVFRRLTAPASGEFDVRARAAVVAQPGAPSPPLSIGGIPSTEHGPQASAYLEALLEAHENETGIPATSSRRPMLSEDFDPDVHRTPRVPEEKAKEIFDRLYRSGKEHRVRRRVYHELGLLVEQAKEAQTCTFEPRVPLAAYPGGQPPEGSVTERLYRDSFERIRRRDDLKRSCPAPSFKPQTTAPPQSLGLPRRLQGNPSEGFSPRDADGPDALGMEDGEGEPDFEPGLGPHFEPPHMRLFREHQERLERQRNRAEAEADWRKFSYRPDISSSQASGPQVVRSASMMALQPAYLEDDPEGEFGDQAVVATLEDEAEGPSLAALAADALTTPRSEANEGDQAEYSEALLLVFPGSRTPAPEGFEEELLNGLALLGAECLSQVQLRLIDLDNIVAELRGPREALTLLRELHLFDLTVSGLRVGEVRWTTSQLWPEQDPGMSPDDVEIVAAQDVDASQAPNFVSASLVGRASAEGGPASSHGPTPPRTPPLSASNSAAQSAFAGALPAVPFEASPPREEPTLSPGSGSGEVLGQAPNSPSTLGHRAAYVKPPGSSVTRLPAATHVVERQISREASASYQLSHQSSHSVLTPLQQTPQQPHRTFSGRVQVQTAQQPVVPSPARGGMASVGVAQGGGAVSFWGSQTSEVSSQTAPIGTTYGATAGALPQSPRLVARGATSAQSYATAQQRSLGTPVTPAFVTSAPTFATMASYGQQAGVLSTQSSQASLYSASVPGRAAETFVSQRAAYPQVLRAGY